MKKRIIKLTKRLFTDIILVPLAIVGIGFLVSLFLFYVGLIVVYFFPQILNNFDIYNILGIGYLVVLIPVIVIGSFKIFLWDFFKYLKQSWQETEFD